MPSLKNLTKAELLARIDAAERAAIEAIQREEAARERVAELEDQVSALMTVSRQPEMPMDAYPVVMMAGQRCYKVRRLEHGRMVTTYKPVEARQ